MASQSASVTWSKSVGLLMPALLTRMETRPNAAASFAADAWKEAEVGGTKIYTDANGMTLYTYDKDGKGKSNCYDKCATNLPPLKAEAGAKGDDECSDFERTYGSKMWAYHGKPVYSLFHDAPNKPVGDGEGGVWHILPYEK